VILLSEEDLRKYGLQEQIVEAALQPKKTFRDAVWGDIQVNGAELSVIDTEPFQRLRGISQLGSADRVYPTAKHDRFQHSLGVLHKTEELIQCVNANLHSQKIANYPRLVIRLAALLHDLAVIAFSHTLEDEGNLFDSQWHNDNRVKYFFSGKAPIRERLESFIVGLGEQLSPKQSPDQLKSAREIARQTAEGMIADSLSILGIKADVLAAIEVRRTPNYVSFGRYGSDIVGNTVCADLLDYVARDYYFCGIKKMFDERFAKYATVHEGQFSYQLFTQKGTGFKFRRPVLSTLLDLMELRYYLTEVVHRHPAVICFSAMLIEATNFSYQQTTKQKEIDSKITQLTDHDLIRLLERDGHEASKFILDRYERREKYVQIVEMDWAKAEPKWDSAIDPFLRNPKMRCKIEATIADWAGVPIGAVAIYCPDQPDRMFKEMDVKVVWKNNDILTLTDVATGEVKKDFRPSLTKEIQHITYKREELRRKYDSLWSATVFLAADHRQAQDKVVANCKEVSDFYDLPWDIPSGTIAQSSAVELVVQRTGVTATELRKKIRERYFRGGDLILPSLTDLKDLLA
jgi:HD superfamily phosphohydrolase